MANQEDVKQAVSETGKIVTVYDFFEKQKGLIAKALPKALTPDRLIGLFTMLIKSSPELMSCSQESLIAAVIQTIQLGLNPGAINHVYLVPFNNKKKNGAFIKECQLILGYRGMIELVNRSGKAAIIATECVYEKDAFDYSFGLEPTLEHKPASQDRGAIIGVYCIAKNLIVNEKVFVYLNKQEIDKVRKASKAGQSNYSPWNTWYEEMAKKTAVKRIFKLLPLSVDIQKQICADETIKTEISPDMIEVADTTNWEESTDVKTEPVKKIDTTATAKDDNPKPEINVPENVLKAIDNLKPKISEKKFLEILGDMGYTKPEELPNIAEANKFISAIGVACATGREA